PGGPIRWRLHIPVPPKTVFEALDTDAGRAGFWAESAVERDGRIEFRFFNGERCSSAILERRMYCPRCESDVHPSEQVRGFRVESGEFVKVSNDELESLAPERSRAIEIERFVDVAEIDVLYYDRPYYLLPGEGAEKPYWLLVNALEETERAGISKLVLSGGEHLVAVTARDDILRLHTLRFARQIVFSNGLAPDDDGDGEDDLDELLEFIDENSGEFDAADYVAENDRRLLEFIRETVDEEGVKRSSRSRRKQALSRSKAKKRIDRDLDAVGDKD
ncbi:MAG: Ku protein, partial [Candidatus Wenzhouxiangella sp. M2_3B_020]